MTRLIAVYGSPRRNGNTAALLKSAIEGAKAEGASVDEIVLRDLELSPCLEIYGCRKNGNCVIADDFNSIRDKVLEAQGMMLASPIFFYTVSAHTKIFMDRFQSLWVRKHWVENASTGRRPVRRKGLFIAAGATQGRKLFDGALLTVRYFFDVLDMDLSDQVLIHGLDRAGEVLKHPEYIEAARKAGATLAAALNT
ncbi:MAG: flavodoxin family protein [Desulfobacterales bacterium]